MFMHIYRRRQRHKVHMRRRRGPDEDEEEPDPDESELRNFERHCMLLDSKQFEGRQLWQVRTWLLFEDGSSSIAASVLQTTILVMIVFSTGLILAQSVTECRYVQCASSSCAPEFPVVPYEQLPACKPTSNTMLSTPCRRVCKERLEPLEDGGPLHFFVLDAICIGVFSVEFICRMLASPATIGLRAFITNVPNWIDLIAILPFYIDLIIFLIAGGSSGGKVRQQVRLEPDAASRAWTPYRISGAAAE